ncbi:hypothetical protein ACFOEE_19875 [Pseudoalteromonas fenneropenaei]|uniref:Letm1 RBD domain-containing protein n=1 Tax=Pseudoalteromonas fenneropenaei TaxID=1737459 RepID=A0ABV7CQ15_9GAMM
MRIYRMIHKAPIRVVRISKRRQQLKLRRSLIALKFALRQERDETKVMLDIYRRYTVGQAKPRELKIANAQFFDLLKGLGLGVFAVLPFAPITIPIIVKLGQWLGVDVLPSSFNFNKPKNRIRSEATKKNVD